LPKTGHPGRFTGHRLDGSDKQMFGEKQQVPHGSKQLQLDNAACEAARSVKEEKDYGAEGCPTGIDPETRFSEAVLWPVE
jgi:hypothetical protein